MKCTEFRNNLIGLIEGTLQAGLKSDMEEHMLHCMDCYNIYENVKSTYTIRDNIKVPEVTPYFYNRLEQKLKNKEAHTSFVLSIFNGPWQNLAASILVASGIFIGVYLGKYFGTAENNVYTTNENDVINTYVSEYYIDYTFEDNNENNK